MTSIAASCSVTRAASLKPRPRPPCSVGTCRPNRPLPGEVQNDVRRYASPLVDLEGVDVARGMIPEPCNDPIRACPRNLRCRPACRQGRRRRQGRSRAPDGSTMRSRRDRSHEGCGRGRSPSPCFGPGRRIFCPRSPPTRRAAPGAQALDRRVLEHRPHRQLPARRLRQARHQAHRQQRVAAQLEEAVQRPHPLHSQQRP